MQKKLTKEQTINTMLAEMDYLRFGNETSEYRFPTIDDINERHCKYYVKTPDWCGYDGEGGCYTYCNKDAKGGFPVYAIELKDLKK